MTKNCAADNRTRACTTILVGKRATADGSVLVAHTDDDISDERVIQVPGRTWDLTDPREAVRRVYYDDASLGAYGDYNSTAIRRYIGPDRGPGYMTQSEGYGPSRPLGTIPQVPRTFGYFDAAYGIMNDQGLMIGECTCGAKVHPGPDPQKRIFYSSELSRVALERCRTPREALGLIGGLIRDYGYYGTGETLLISDADEGWVLEMCGYDAGGSDGIWVAQRVPDDQVFVAANEFRIRDICRSPDEGGPESPLPYHISPDPDHEILYSKNLFSVCAEKGWIKEGTQVLDWLPTVSHGEYSHPYYSLRRVWRVLSLVAPLTRLSPWVEGGYTRAYPFSVMPQVPLDTLTLAEVFRDQYEGTEFDLTRGPGAGPFGNPVRYDVNPDKGDSFDLETYHPHGAWERPVSIYRCGVMWINQARRVGEKTLGVSWIGFDRPTATCLMPFPCGISSLPAPIQTMNLLEFRFRGDSAWWAFNFVATYLGLNHRAMIADLRNLQTRLETRAQEAVDQAFADGNFDILAEFCENNVQEVLEAWWSLAERLVVTYNAGCRTTGPNAIMERLDYPEEWLTSAGYWKGPVRY